MDHPGLAGRQALLFRLKESSIFLTMQTELSTLFQKNNPGLKYSIMKSIISFLFIIYSFLIQAQSPRISFQAPMLYPEGITADGATGGFYVSSVIDGTIGKVDAQ